MTSLPPAKEANIDICESRVLNAYNVALSFERSADSQKDVLHARILGYLILFAPSIDARDELARAIHSCDQKHDTLSELGQDFIDWFIRPFRNYRRKGRTPGYSSSEYSSSSSSHAENMEEALEVPESLKIQALKRDGHRCVITGKYDFRVDEYLSNLSEEDIYRAGIAPTRCTHIMPDLNYVNLSIPGNLPEQKFYSSPVFAVLKCFGYDVENLNGPKVHSLFNVLTLEVNMWIFFDRLEIWLGATEVRDCYRIEVMNKYRGLLKVPEKITLTSSDPVNLPVTSPKFLALHATCAKVAQFSGASAYIDELDEDVEDLGVLVGDG